MPSPAFARCGMRHPCKHLDCMLDSADRYQASDMPCTSLDQGPSSQGFDVLFYGDSITMRWRDDWPANQWGAGPPPANSPGGTPMGIFNQTFRTNFTSEILGIGSEFWCAERNVCITNS